MMHYSCWLCCFATACIDHCVVCLWFTLRIAVDERLGVVGHADIFALGDCAGYDVSTGKTVLPALAQVP